MSNNNRTRVFKKLTILVVGIILIISLISPYQINKENTALGASIINTIKQSDIQVEIKDQKLIINYLGKQDKRGIVRVKPSDISSQTKAETIEASYEIRYHTYNKSKNNKQDPNREILDLGIQIQTDKDEYILPLPTDLINDNNNLGIIVYIALKEIGGTSTGFKAYNQINLDLTSIIQDKPQTFKTNGKFYGDDGQGYASLKNIQQYIKELPQLTDEEATYRKEEIEKYTSYNDFITDNNILVNLGKKIRAETNSDNDFIDRVYQEIRDISYDYDLFNYNKETGRLYVPDIESQFKNGKAICLDKSWMIATILRSQSIPTKIVDGKLIGIGGHSWNEVLIDNQWIHLDATEGPGLYGASDNYIPIREY